MDLEAIRPSCESALQLGLWLFLIFGWLFDFQVISMGGQPYHVIYINRTVAPEFPVLSCVTVE